MIKLLRRPGIVASALVAAVFASAGPAAAHRRHRAHAVPAAASASPHSFYPETIQGGVPGNLSFNNQLRKLSDPLNANGGR